MHRMHRFDPEDPRHSSRGHRFLTTSSIHPSERHEPPAARAGREGRCPASSLVRERAPAPEPATFTRSSVAEAIARHARARRDRRAVLFGISAGTIFCVAILIARAPWLLTSRWVVVAIPLWLMWAAIGGLVAVCAERERRGEPLLPELGLVTGSGSLRAALKPIAIGLALGGVLVAAIHVAIQAMAWIPLHLT